MRETQHTLDRRDEIEINTIKSTLKPEIRKLLKHIGKHQQEDNTLKKIIDAVQAPDSTQLQDRYQWFNQRLYRKEKGRWRLMMTTRLAQQMIAEIHTAYSHIGITKTYNLFQECFTSNAAHKRMKKIIKSCDICQKCKD